jgi:hypothetical protein
LGAFAEFEVAEQGGEDGGEDKAEGQRRFI